MKTPSVDSMPCVVYVTSIHPDFNSRVWKTATAAARNGLEVHLVCPWDVRNGSVRENVMLHTFGRVEKRYFRPFLIPFRLLRRLLPLLGRADIVHFHDIDILPWMALLSLSVPVVYDVHENYADEMLVRDWVPGILRKPMYHLVLRLERYLAWCVRNVVLAVPSQEALFRGSRFNTVPLRNYASLELLERVRDDYTSRADIVVFTGGNYESNGSMLLLEIAARVCQVRPGVRFVVVDWFASDAFRSRFMRERSRRRLEDSVRILPVIPPHELMSLLNECTIALAVNLRVPKQEKAIPTKLFEYMAAGLPIVSSDLPYQKVLFSKGTHGLLAQPEDPASFVDAIVALVDDRSMAHTMGEAGKKLFVQEFSWEAQIPILITYYRSILAKQPSTRRILQTGV